MKRVALVLAALLALGLGLLLSRPEPPARAPQEPAARSTPSPDGSPTASAEPPATAPAADARKRTRIPRPAQASAPRKIVTRTASASSDPAAPSTSEDPTRDNILARRDAIREDISACIARWGELEPGLEGRVLVEFELDERGLSDAWIADHDGVPEGTLDCFSEAVWHIDWEGTVALPLTVSLPFVLTTDDPG